MIDCLRIVTLALLCVAGSGVEARVSGRSLGTLQFEPCTLSATGLPASIAAQCGTLAVPEDRERPAGRSIDLAIALVPSTA
ncbi:MAG: hypothetical protein QG601_1578 [Pseudomonadota bacterium]|nr:hypothetical protein [Pseudomonadota bacterium]